LGAEARQEETPNRYRGREREGGGGMKSEEERKRGKERGREGGRKRVSVCVREREGYSDPTHRHERR
jgi:hypothetical protein